MKLPEAAEKFRQRFVRIHFIHGYRQGKAASYEEQVMRLCGGLNDDSSYTHNMERRGYLTGCAMGLLGSIKDQARSDRELGYGYAIYALDKLGHLNTSHIAAREAIAAIDRELAYRSFARSMLITLNRQIKISGAKKSGD